jgi:hypothetical protein
MLPSVSMLIESMLPVVMAVIVLLRFQKNLTVS